MTDRPSALVSVPQAHIVWNEARNEGVIFVDQETTGWPLTAADDAYQASTGKSRHPGLGSALAEAFYEGYEDDEDRPVQVVPASIFTPAAPQAAGVGEVWPVGSWLSAALDDPNVCDEMKADIRLWFEGGGHLRAQPQAREDAQPVAPFGYWVTHPVGENPIFIRYGSFVPADDRYSVQPLYTHPAPDALRVLDTERMLSCLNDLRPSDNKNSRSTTAYNYLLSVIRLAALQAKPS